MCKSELKSKVWSYFDVKKNDNKVAICKLCTSKTFKILRLNKTTNLWRYLESVDAKGFSLIKKEENDEKYQTKLLIDNNNNVLSLSRNASKYTIYNITLL